MQRAGTEQPGERNTTATTCLEEDGSSKRLVAKQIRWLGYFRGREELDSCSGSGRWMVKAAESLCARPLTG